MSDFSCGLDRCGLKERKTLCLEPFQTLLKRQPGDWEGVDRDSKRERARTESALHPPRLAEDSQPAKGEAARERTGFKHLLQPEKKFVYVRFSHQSSKNVAVPSPILPSLP